MKFIIFAHFAPGDYAPWRARNSRTAEPWSREGGEGRNCYKHGIVFLHSDEDHVTVIHFRRNYLCSALRVATRRDATRLRRARTNRVSRYAKAVTDQNKIGFNAALSLSFPPSLSPSLSFSLSSACIYFRVKFTYFASSRSSICELAGGICLPFHPRSFPRVFS